jgi:hypothetical protein
MKIAKILWRDSHRYTYQMENADGVDITLIATVGFLVSMDKEKVILSQDDIEGELRGVIAIPRENIVKIIKIKEGS